MGRKSSRRGTKANQNVPPSRSDTGSGSGLSSQVFDAIKPFVANMIEEYFQQYLGMNLASTSVANTIDLPGLVESLRLPSSFGRKENNSLPLTSTPRRSSASVSTAAAASISGADDRSAVKLNSGAGAKAPRATRNAASSSVSRSSISTSNYLKESAVEDGDNQWCGRLRPSRMTSNYLHESEEEEGDLAQWRGPLRPKKSNNGKKPYTRTRSKSSAAILPNQRNADHSPSITASTKDHNYNTASSSLSSRPQDEYHIDPHWIRPYSDCKNCNKCRKVFLKSSLSDHEKICTGDSDSD